MTDHFMHIKQILHTLYSIPRDDCLRTNSKSVYSRTKIMMKVNRREKGGLIPDPDTNIFIKILGLDICADTLFGDAMRRGISGGQKKRLTIGNFCIYFPI
ncbi:hypothetical protein HanXRQr2_Chr03g0118561 [Helianthus annuus]|uniref:P-loop containing nucleoside triphosphate hydrolase n=1 Tax=Helianthus annuus TaxID=4232 RepID=A0A9K3NWW9_HELAN|nr:hypothetical protein HanXRQr2_Chr03g0118561 [Helianthus annuus]KAJ0944316.1 hypothetical protein HanPSC8_Chr03g0115201 [Helianthus annuus]